jgi:cytochrome c biogenesis protein CcdA/thiol-disulfide isomerase/thioredoxin
MERLAVTVTAILCIVVLLLPPVFAQDPCPALTPCTDENVTTGIGGTAQPICIYFFYGLGCPHCERTKPVIEALVKKYPQVQLKAFEIYFNTTNQAMFKEFNKRYAVTEGLIPSVFIGDRALVGENAVRTALEERIIWYTTNPAICPAFYSISGGLPQDGSPAQLGNLTAQSGNLTPHPGNMTPQPPNLTPQPGQTPDLVNLPPPGPAGLTIPAIVVAAAIDSINPCAFAVLIFLLAYLTSLGERRRILMVGVTYIATVFVVYFMAGLGLLTVVQQLGLTGIVFTFAAVIAIIAGLINIAEVLLNREIFTLAIPVSQKAAIDKYVKRASVPSAIVLGALVSMVELPCTGGVYLAILGLIGDRMTLMEGIPYLLFYNLIFVLPLILILLLVYWGGTPERMEAFRTGSSRWVRLVMGIVMVALGAAMLLGVI